MFTSINYLPYSEQTPASLEYPGNIQYMHLPEVHCWECVSGIAHT